MLCAPWRRVARGGPVDAESLCHGVCGNGSMLTAARRTFTDEVAIRLGEPLSTSELQRFAATVHTLRTHLREQRRSA